MLNLDKNLKKYYFMEDNCKVTFGHVKEHLTLGLL